MNHLFSFCSHHLDTFELIERALHHHYQTLNGIYFGRTGLSPVLWRNSTEIMDCEINPTEVIYYISMHGVFKTTWTSSSWIWVHVRRRVLYAIKGIFTTIVEISRFHINSKCHRHDYLHMLCPTMQSNHWWQQWGWLVFCSLTCPFQSWVWLCQAGK